MGTAGGDWLRTDDVLRRELEGTQTDRIQVDPPAAVPPEQFVSEEVGKTGITPVTAIAKDGGCRKDFLGVLHHGPVRDVLHVRVDEQMKAVSVAQEGMNAHPLHDGEFRPDPEALDDLVC